jgi:hypothetical protein
VPNVVPAIALAVIILLTMPLWPWSRGWTWAPAGILTVGLLTLVLFSLAVVPEG